MKKSPCGYCGKLYPFRPNKKFCSDICKVKSWREGGTLSSAPCVYCGIPATTIDHVPPRVARPRLTAMGLVGRYPFLEVDACHECNSVLGSRTLWTLPERKRFIKKWLAKRYAKYLRIPDWTAEEVGSIGIRSMLPRFIEQGLIVRDITRERIAWK